MKILYSSIKFERDAIEKRRELESKTGLKLTCYPTGAGWNFRPYLHAGIKESSLFSGDVFLALPKNSTGLSFTSIAEKLNLRIEDVLEAVQFLKNHGWINCEISRDGKIVGAERRN